MERLVYQGGDMTPEEEITLNTFVAQFKTLKGVFFNYSLHGLHRQKSRIEDEFEEFVRKYLPRDFGTSFRSNARIKALVFGIPVGAGTFFVPEGLRAEYDEWLTWLHGAFKDEVDSLEDVRGIIENNIEILKKKFTEKGKEIMDFDELIRGMSISHYEKPNPLEGISEVGHLSQFELNYVVYVLNAMRGGYHQKYANSIEHIAEMVEAQIKPTKSTVRMIMQRIRVMDACDVFNVYQPLLEAVEFSLKEYLDDELTRLSRLTEVSQMYTGRLRIAITRLRGVLDIKNQDVRLRQMKRRIKVRRGV